MGFCSYVEAEEARTKYTVVYDTSTNGTPIVALQSYVNHYAYCYFLDSRGYLILDFYLDPYGRSRWYRVPNQTWTWRCQ